MASFQPTPLNVTIFGGAGRMGRLIGGAFIGADPYNLITPTLPSF